MRIVRPIILMTWINQAINSINRWETILWLTSMKEMRIVILALKKWDLSGYLITDRALEITVTENSENGTRPPVLFVEWAKTFWSRYVCACVVRLHNKKVLRTVHDRLRLPLFLFRSRGMYFLGKSFLFLYERRPSQNNADPPFLLIR